MNKDDENIRLLTDEEFEFVAGGRKVDIITGDVLDFGCGATPPAESKTK